jgi:gelsolin
VIEGFETVTFKSKFIEWPPTPDLKLSSEDGRVKVAGYSLDIISSLNLKNILSVLVQDIAKIQISHFYPLFFLAALLKSQGLDVKGLMKTAPVKEEPRPYIDCTGHLQVLSYPTLRALCARC